MFKKLLFKLTKGCVFLVTEKLLKQVNGCSIDGPVSVIFSNIFTCKMEFDSIVPDKPIFYRRYVDDTYVRRKKNDVDKLFEELNSYHKNIKLTLEVNQTKFLNTELVREKGQITTQVSVSQQSYLCIGVQKFLLHRSAVLSLENHIEQNDFSSKKKAVDSE